MQDFQSIAGLAGRIFGGGLDLRRPRGVLPAAAAAQGPVKCPRCESTDTKFCYYNNYNLSQPRHFCKACRRYWTKGGLLRNVPVGGGCRKSKRSSSSSKSSAAKSTSSSPAAGGGDKPRRAPSASRSSSNSSNPKAVDGSTPSSSLRDTSILHRPTSNPKPDSTPTFDPNPPMAAAEGLSQAPELFPDTAGIFSAGADLGFSFLDPASVTLPAQARPVAEQMKAAQGISAAGFVDLQLFDGRSGGGTAGGSSFIAFAGMDWTGPVEPSLFDLAGAGDAGAYWSQSGWGDADPSTLYLP